MKNKYVILFLLFFSALSLKCNAQIAFGVVKDENRSVIDYKLEWGYAYLFQAETAARQYLKNKGYNTIAFPAFDSVNIKSGYYVVAKSTYNDDKGKSHTSMGMGVSSGSYEEAEVRAAINIGAHDWSWKISMGYKIVEKGEFSSKGGLQCVYIIDKAKNSDCGNYATKYNTIIGSMDKRLYDNMKKGIESKCT